MSEEGAPPAQPPLSRRGVAWARVWARRRELALGMVPVVVALVLGALLLPRAVPASDVPLPEVDRVAFARTVEDDRARAAHVAVAPLPGDVRALGSAIRAFNARQAEDAPEVAIAEARAALDRALAAAIDAGGVAPLVDLRAAQLEAFLAEVRAFESTGHESPELGAVGGPFVRRMRLAGWCVGHRVAMPEEARRGAFKLAWNAMLAQERRPELAVTLDEQRALYTFFLRAPHAPEAVRARLDAARRGARDEAACRAIDEGERMAAEAWRATKVRALGAIDPSYPASFALGVALQRAGEATAASEAFRDWLRAHPDGPWTLRARNHLRAALDDAQRD